MGFNADIDIAGGGTGSSLSVNGGKTNLNADYQAVGEQSGIFANEADLVAEGKGTFKGGVFATSKEAQANGNSNIVFKQGVTATDLKNTTSYDGDAISIGLSAGKERKPSMSGLGYGTDSDSDSSITKGGVSGYNDKEGIFTTDNREAIAGKLENNFDASRVNEELVAQTQITQEFGKEAPKAVGDYASNRQLDLINEGKVDEAEKWAEGGAYRVALHTLVGAIATGSVDGALASGTTAVSIPAVDAYLENQGVDETTRDVLLLGLSAAAGAVVGGDTASTATSFSQTQNNYLNHIQLQQWINDLKKAKGNGRRIDEINTYYKNLDKKQQAAFTNDCETNYNYQRCGQHIKNYYAGSGQYKGNTLFDPKLYSQIENLGGLGRGSLRTGVTFNNDQFLSRYSRWESDASYRQDGILGLIAQGAIGVGGSRIVKGATSKASNSTSSSSMLGANGTQTSSKTVWKEKGSKARIDVENPAPGERPGQVHYQDANNAKYYYNPADGKLYTGKISDGLVAPKSIQKLLKNDDFKNGINKGLKYLGE